jgi:hypothetical protein
LKDDIGEWSVKLREAVMTSAHMGKEVDRLTNLNEALQQQLKIKDDDLRVAASTLHNFQREFMEEKRQIESRVQSLEKDRLLNMTDLALKKQETANYLRDIEQLRNNIVSYESKLQEKERELIASKDYLMQIELEKELRTRSEAREEAERRERIAANAQLMAIQTECNLRIQQSEADHTIEKESLSRKVKAALEKQEVLLSENKDKANLIMGMQSEIQQLRYALENPSVNHESIEKLGKVTGELEILKKQMKESEENQVRLYKIT